MSSKDKLFSLFQFSLQKNFKLCRFLKRREEVPDKFLSIFSLHHYIIGSVRSLEPCTKWYSQRHVAMERTLLCRHHQFWGAYIECHTCDSFSQIFIYQISCRCLRRLTLPASSARVAIIVANYSAGVS